MRLPRRVLLICKRPRRLLLCVVSALTLTVLVMRTPSTVRYMRVSRRVLTMMMRCRSLRCVTLRVVRVMCRLCRSNRVLPVMASRTWMMFVCPQVRPWIRLRVSPFVLPLTVTPLSLTDRLACRLRKEMIRRSRCVIRRCTRAMRMPFVPLAFALSRPRVVLSRLRCPSLRLSFPVSTSLIVRFARRWRLMTLYRRRGV